jgi:MoxR-like ATPase
MALTKIFDPIPEFQDFREDSKKGQRDFGDRRDGKVYLYNDHLVLAINVAIVTGRPLLLRGAPGCGKSSVAYNIARVMGRCYYEKVISSRMQANDLCWRFDAIRRLGDAQVAGAAQKSTALCQNNQFPWSSFHPYIEPEVFWWIFDAESAQRRGLPEEEILFFEPAQDPAVFYPNPDEPHHRAVVLLDEIDKAEPDVPNNLLVVLGSMQFYVTEIQQTVTLESRKQPSLLAPEDLPLIVITTNEERTLPMAFLRRCVVYEFKPIKENQLVEIAKHIEGPKHLDLYEKIAKKMMRLTQKKSDSPHERLELNIAEYLDTVRACLRMGGTGIYDQLIENILKYTTSKKSSYF